MEEPKQQNDKLKKAIETREFYRHKSFILMLEVAFIIGVPAFIAAITGTKLDANYDSGKQYTIILSGVALIISWIIIIFKYKKFNKKLMDAEKQVQELREQEK